MMFHEIRSGDNIKEVIKSAFDLDLDVSGEWGYDQNRALIIHSFDGDIKQLEHTLASIRAYIEMNMSLPEERRHGGINVNEIGRKTIRKNNKIYDKIIYEVSGMPEKRYAEFIEEYKKMYELPDFDIEDHFRRRRENTVILNSVFWFDISNIK